MRRTRSIDAKQSAACLLVKLLGLCLVMFVASYIALWGSERDSVGSAGGMNYARDARPSPSAPAS